MLPQRSRKQTINIIILVSLTENSYFLEANSFPISPLSFQLLQGIEAHVPVPFQTKLFRCFISRLYWILLTPCFQSTCCLYLPWYSHAPSSFSPVLPSWVAQEEHVSCRHTCSLTLPCSCCTDTTSNHETIYAGKDLWDNRVQPLA